MEAVTCRSCGAANASGRTCEHCGSSLPRRRSSLIPEVASLPDEHPSVSLVVRPSHELRVRFGPGAEIVLGPGDRLVIGRSPVSPVRDRCTDNISFLHAELFVNAAGAFVVDTGSTNGTFVDGVRLAAHEARLLAGSNVISLASDPPLQVYTEVEP